MKAVILKYGLLAGIVVNGLMFGPIAVFGERPDWFRYGEIFGYSAMVLTMTATYFAIRHARSQQDGPFGFSRGLAIGVGVTAVASFLFGVATYAFYRIMGDGFPQRLWDHYVAEIRGSGADATTVARQLAELESMRPLFFNYAFQAAVMFATLFLIGLAVSLVSAVILRRRARHSTVAASALIGR